MADPSDTRDHLKRWIENVKKASEMLPGVQRSFELLDWQCDTLAKLPEDKRGTLNENAMNLFTRNYGEIRNALPMIPTYNAQSITLCGTLAVSGASATFEHISKIQDQSDTTFTYYYESQARNYTRIQQSQNRLDEVRELLKIYFTANILRQYETTISTYYSAKSGVGERAAVAGEMRTLLDNIKGELWQKARSHYNENMTWGEMVARLCPLTRSSVFQTQLIDQEQSRSEVYDVLSIILKRREGAGTRNIDDLWAMVLDHIYVVCNCLVV